MRSEDMNPPLTPPRRGTAIARPLFCSPPWRGWGWVRSWAKFSFSSRVVPRTQFALQPAQQKIHRETKRREQREVRIDHAHVQQLRLQPDAVAEANIAHHHLGGDEID